MWITNQKAFKKSAVLFWPGSEVKIEGQYPTHYFPVRETNRLFMYNVRAG